MDEAVKEVWINALRSNEYTKTEGVLFAKANPQFEREVDCHCSLGVLCEEAAKAGVITVDESREGSGRFGEVRGDSLIPEAVIDWAGFGDFSTDQARVARLNDMGDPTTRATNGTTFAQLADFIEENF